MNKQLIHKIIDAIIKEQYDSEIENLKEKEYNTYDGFIWDLQFLDVYKNHFHSDSQDTRYIMRAFVRGFLRTVAFVPITMSEVNDVKELLDTLQTNVNHSYYIWKLIQNTADGLGIKNNNLYVVPLVIESINYVLKQKDDTGILEVRAKTNQNAYELEMVVK